MKKIGMVGALCICAALGLQAQNHYDANRLMQTDLNGTARFVGMGGAMSALGGDISTIGTNPAGIGIYRSNDAVISFGFNRSNSESMFSGKQMNDGRTLGSFDNAGVIYSMKIGNKTDLRYVNFGFNYHKVKGFNKRMVMGGEYLTGVSQTDQMANQANGLPSSDFGRDNVWGINGIGWLSILGWESYLIYEDEGADKKNTYVGFPSTSLPYGDFRSRESGGINSYDINLSLNIKDRVYLGFTLGVYDVDYVRRTWYREGFDYTEATGDRSFYTLNNYFQTTGAGIDFKMGLIVRPFEDSPLRIGAAVHTPTIFHLKDLSEATLLSDVDDLNGTVKQYDVYTPDGGALTEYDIVTPWKYNLSLGYTVGRKWALGAEYEFCNYGKAKIRDYDGNEMGKGDGVFMNQLNKIHTLRVGAEFKPLPQLALRVGYNHSNASLRRGAFKVLPYEGPNSVRTDTEFANTRAVNNYTAGIGYRWQAFYVDFAYQCKMYHEDFYPFDNVDLPATDVKNVRHQGLFTLGVRF